MDWKHLHKLKFSDLHLDQEDKTILDNLAEKLQNNYPYHSVNYAGQMIKPPHVLAQAAYWMSTYVNPNNHALDGGKATSTLEIEVIQSSRTRLDEELAASSNTLLSFQTSLKSFSRKYFLINSFKSFKMYHTTILVKSNIHLFWNFFLVLSTFNAFLTKYSIIK